MIMMQNHDASLDLDAVRAFTLVAELQSFTRAAQIVGMTQSAISLKLKRLEARLDARLIERTPRSVELTAEGAAFLDRAHDLLAAHDRALSRLQVPERRLTLGISDHVAGPNLADVLARMNAVDPNLHLNVQIGFSGVLLDAFESKKIDAVIVRQETHRRGGEVLFEDETGWFAAADFRHRTGTKLRLAMLAAPCGVRAHAIRLLDKAKIGWTEAFTGGGVTAIAAAIMAGLGVAPLARRVAPAGTLDVGPALSLPSLGRSKVMLHARVSNKAALGVLRTLTAVFRGTTAK